MSEHLAAIYQSMRLQVLTLEDNYVPGYGTDSSYKFAWDNEVYPFYHQGVRFHEPFETEFSVSGNQVKEIAELLDSKWLEKEKITFYELEELYEKYGSYLDREKLVDICQYLHLKRKFNDDFWKGFLSDSPLEASCIT